MDSTFLITSDGESDATIEASGHLAKVCDFPKEGLNRINVTVGDFKLLKGEIMNNKLF